MIKEIKVVIGANYGDEGKGLVTSYLSQEAAKRNKKILNVLYNGSCQRGHTVDINENIKHTFHHFGSGTLSGADTYFDKDFMVNPIFFNEEYAELKAKFLIEPVSYVDPRCRFVTPYDMILNQIIEEQRDKERHGSCGYGVFECRLRNEHPRLRCLYGSFCEKTDSERREYLNWIRKIYLPKRLQDLNYEISEKWKRIIDDTGIIEQYLIDFKRMEELCTMKYMFSAIESDTETYDTIIFEGGQGLALDEDNLENYPNLTPSHTGSNVPIERVVKDSILKNYSIEICYVTRSYFTRHGAGNFPTECSINEINKDIVDDTNVYNNFQHNIRYGKFDFGEFYNRVSADYIDMLLFTEISTSIKTSLFVTHLNYTNEDIYGNTSLKRLEVLFENVYVSNSKYAKDIKCIKSEEVLNDND